MRNIIILCGVLFVVAAGFSDTREQKKPVNISISAGIGFPLQPDPALFQPGGGCAVSGSYAVPFFNPVSAGILFSYQQGRMSHSDLGYIGVISVISTGFTVEYRLRVIKWIDLYISGECGYFFAFLIDNSSSVSGPVWKGHAGIGLRVLPELTIGVQCGYKNYQSFYHLFDAGIRIDLWFG